MTGSGKRELSLKIKNKAFELGFDICGIAPARTLDEHKPVLKKWIASGMNGKMDYLAQNIEKKVNPELIVSGAKSVIVAGLNYFTNKKQGGDGIPIISKYAYGLDYHYIVKARLEKLLRFVLICYPQTKGRTFVDSSPLLEKAWAREAGLGWYGRNSIIINTDIGSFFFLGELVLDLDLEYDKPFTGDHCGDCRSCIDSCPTAAINENKTIDARRCISYLTVENIDPIPKELAGKMGGRIFGCDKCQEVCPWNKGTKSHCTPEFDISSELENLTREEWLSLSEEDFNRFFRKSSVMRAKYTGLIRNISFVADSWK